MTRKEKMFLAVVAFLILAIIIYFVVAFYTPRYLEETAVSTTVVPKQIQRPTEILVSESPTAEVTPEPQPQPAPPPPPYPSKIS